MIMNKESFFMALEYFQNAFSSKGLIIFFCLLCAAMFIVLVLVFLTGKKIGILLSRNNLSKILKDERSDAVKRSRSVIGGQVFEQLAPLFPDFPADYADARFIGKPVDFIAFCGLEESSTEGWSEINAETVPAPESTASVKQNKCHVNEILFIEVKTEKSQLSEREKAIKEAVQSKRVRWVEYRIE